ncbi:MAG: TonB-dependent receptor [bacterium]|nr:TonB-dependent receptor [bacterium]
MNIGKELRFVVIVLAICGLGFLPAWGEENQVEDIMEISLEDLLNNEVVVAGKKAQSISDSAGIISVLTAEDIETLGVVNLVDVFSYIPGFTVTDNYWTREIVTAREVFQALYNDKILLLIDGMPAYEAINTEYYLDLLPIEAVERIEIIRGPGSTLYGTNAFAGVVNIITKRGESISGMEIKATAGAFGLFEKTVTIGRKIGDLDIFFAGNIRDDDGYTHIIPFDEGSGVNLRQSFRKEFSRAHLRMGYKDFALSLQVLEYDFEHFGMVPSAWAQGPVKHHTYNIGFSYNGKLSDKLTTTNMFRVMRQVRENYGGIFGTLFPGSDIRVDGQMAEAPTYLNWKSVIYQFESQWNYTVSDKLSLVGGATVERRDPYNITTLYDDWGMNDEERIEGLTGSYTYPPEKNKIDYGIYVQGDLRMKRLGIVGGVRYTHMGVAEKSFVAPRAAFIFDITKKFKLKALYGMAFRSPTAYETEVFVKNVLYGGKTAIDPEKVSTVELGLDYIGKKFGVRANYYYMTIDDIIGRRGLTDAEKLSLGAAGGVIYGNINNQELSGVEVEIKAFPVKNLNFFLNASFRTGKDKDSGVELNYVAKNLFSGGINLKLPALKMELSPNFYYVSKRDGVALDGNTYTFDGYFLMNLRAGIDIFQNVAINLIVRNIGNKHCHFPEMTRNKKGLELPGGIPRSFFLQVAYKFNL